MTSRENISAWFDRGVKDKALFMIILCDGYDFKDFPKYVFSNQTCRQVFEDAHFLGDTFRVMEIYNLRMDKVIQMNGYRSFYGDGTI